MPLSNEDIGDLFERRGEKFFLYCLKITGNKEDAEDALDETFLRVCSHRIEVDTGKNVEGWIYSIARNACIDILRKRGRNQPYPPDDEGVWEIPDTKPSPEEEAIHAEFLAGINRLAPDDREILLKWLEDKSLDELSRELNWPLSKVTNTLYRAKRRLVRAAQR
jgi:RNA polymerase sigma-70 factor, ECF subfamily